MSAYEKVYKIVMRIPKGKVLTYGLISNMLEGPLSAQGVGWALKALPAKKKDKTLSQYNSKTVPWHRVINSKGGTSTHKILSIPPDLQRELLEAEGVVFNADEKIDLQKYLWTKGLSEKPK
jgi:methylated-DNA-protein-cysteine methyltransferase-like protein